MTGANDLTRRYGGTLATGNPDFTVRPGLDGGGIERPAREAPVLADIGSAGKAMARAWPGCGRGPCRAAGVAGIAAAIAVALAACTSAQPSGSTAARGSQSASPPEMSCAWRWEGDVQTDRSGMTDATEADWVQPIVAPAGTRIVLSGRFPDARYASFSVYTPGGDLATGGGVSGSLDDYQIAPQPGSVNPWQHQAAPGGRFTLTIRPDPSPGQANTLPAPAGTTRQHPGYLVYRVFVPAGGSFSDVPLPVLTVKQGNAVRTFPACRAHSAPALARVKGGSADPASAVASLSPQLDFFNVQDLAQSKSPPGFGNADTPYVWAWLHRPPAADVVLVTAKAPTAAPGSHPSPWPAPGEDVRYWSMCIVEGTATLPTVASPLPGGGTDYGCRDDAATRLNAAGYYTYVIGSESQRAAISRVPGVTFLPFATAQSTPLYLLLLRDMLASPSFAHSPGHVTQAFDPAETAAVMGPYFPRAAVCPLATLTAKGPQACQR